MQYSVNHKHHAVHYNSVTYLSGSLNLLTPFPHFVPPNPLPLWTTHLFSVTIIFFFFFEIPYISEIIQYLSFSVCLISLHIMASRFIHITNGNISFLFFWQGQNNFPLCVCVCVCMYITSSVFILDGHLGCFDVLVCC